MTGVQQGGAQQCRQADALALAGKVQSMQQDGTFKQRPEGRQNAQIVHGSEPQRQGPDLLHQGNEQQVRGKLAEDENGEKCSFGAVHQGKDGAPQDRIGLICSAERNEQIFLFSRTFFL